MGWDGATLPRDGTIRVSAATVAFDLDGAEHRRPWEEIGSIRLRVDPQGGVETGIRVPGFRGGPGVFISTGTRLGVHDAARADAYRAFVAALHAALLVWFALRRTGRLAPGSHDPAAVPDDLLPR
jgi:hypothetical protein